MDVLEEVATHRLPGKVQGQAHAEGGAAEEGKAVIFGNGRQGDRIFLVLEDEIYNLVDCADGLVDLVILVVSSYIVLMPEVHLAFLALLGRLVLLAVLPFRVLLCRIQGRGGSWFGLHRAIALEIDFRGRLGIGHAPSWLLSFSVLVGSVCLLLGVPKRKQPLQVFWHYDEAKRFARLAVWRHLFG